MTGDPITVDDGDDTPPPASGAGQKRKRVDNPTDVNAVLLGQQPGPGCSTTTVGSAGAQPRQGRASEQRGGPHTPVR